MPSLAPLCRGDDLAVYGRNYTLHTNICNSLFRASVLLRFTLADRARTYLASTCRARVRIAPAEQPKPTSHAKIGPLPQKDIGGSSALSTCRKGVPACHATPCPNAPPGPLPARTTPASTARASTSPALSAWSSKSTLTTSRTAPGFEGRMVSIGSHRKTVDLFPPTASASPNAPARFRGPSASNVFS